MKFSSRFLAAWRGNKTMSKEEDDRSWTDPTTVSKLFEKIEAINRQRKECGLEPWTACTTGEGHWTLTKPPMSSEELGRCLSHIWPARTDRSGNGV